MNHLLAEWMVGHPILAESTTWMQRGHELEAEAVKAYELLTGRETSKVGFITDDERMVGASPDRLVGADRLLEIKCPKHNTHVGYLLTGKVEQDYKPQLQGQLWMCERDVTDIVSYHPEMPAAIIEVGRDEVFIATLAGLVNAFVERMLEFRERLTKEFGPFQKPEQPAEDLLGITDTDVDRILRSFA